MQDTFTIDSHGDIGDLIQVLPIARHLGRASILVSDHPMCKSITDSKRFNAIKPLIESQEYIHRFDVWEGETITHHVANWREGGVPFGANLLELHSKWIGLDVNQSPWIKVSPDKKFKGKIIVNRSARHHSQYFPWAAVLSHFQKGCVFVGLPEEHYMLEQESGVKIPYEKTSDFLQVSKMIAASKLFIGNQSAALNVAIGLGKRYLCETSLTSVDCLYRRPDSCYVLDGEIVDLKVPGFEPLNHPPILNSMECDLYSSPPGGIWYMNCSDGFEISEYNSFDLLKKVNRREKQNDLRISTASDLAQHMIKRFPTWVGGAMMNPLHTRIMEIRKLIEERNK